MRTHCLWELGDDGEAVNTYWFCDFICRLRFWWRHRKAMPLAFGRNDDWITGTVCDFCTRDLIDGKKVGY